MTAKYSTIFPGASIKVLAVETHEVRRGNQPIEGKALIDVSLMSKPSEDHAEAAIKDFFRRLGLNSDECAEALDASNPTVDEAVIMPTGGLNFTAIVFFSAWHADDDSGPAYGSQEWQREHYEPRSASW